MTVRANGIEFAYLEQGEGPLVLLLHGFPDNAQTWSHLMPALSERGFHVVAPFMRGYPPTEPGEFYDRATLATDAKELIDAMGGPPAFVVGHDWGAATTYVLLAAYPEYVKRAVTLALPHVGSMLKSFAAPEFIHRNFHLWFFQLPGFPENAIRANDFDLIDYIWHLWSPGHEDSRHIAQLKHMFETPGAVEASLAYYRAMFDPAKADPALAEVMGRSFSPISVPTLGIFGAREIPAEVAESQGEFFTGEHRAEVLADCGHFLHRERPDEVAKLVLDWFAES